MNAINTSHDEDPTGYKRRIEQFYDTVSPYFRDLWGPHLHDGLYDRGARTKEEAQDRLVAYLAERAEIARDSDGLDVGCGMGATSVWLARHLGCRMLGVTLSPVQVEMAEALARAEGVDATFLRRDAESLALPTHYDFLWMMGVLGHLPNQRAFVERARTLLRPGGKFVLADWVVTSGISERERRRYVDPVADGMLMPEIFSLEEYRHWFQEAGYRIVLHEDIAENTKQTWDEGVTLSQTPHLYRLAREIGGDTLGLLRAIRGMKTAMKRGSIGYGILVAEWPGSNE